MNEEDDEEEKKKLICQYSLACTSGLENFRFGQLQKPRGMSSGSDLFVYRKANECTRLLINASK